MTSLSSSVSSTTVRSPIGEMLDAHAEQALKCKAAKLKIGDTIPDVTLSRFRSVRDLAVENPAKYKVSLPQDIVEAVSVKELTGNFLSGALEVVSKTVLRLLVDVENVSTRAALNGRFEVLSFMPGVGTPACSGTHLPSLVTVAAELKALCAKELGSDVPAGRITVAVPSSRDAVLDWQRLHDPLFTLGMLPMYDTEFMLASGVVMDKRVPRHLGLVPERFMAIVDKGVVIDVIEEDEPLKGLCVRTHGNQLVDRVRACIAKVKAAEAEKTHTLTSSSTEEMSAKFATVSIGSSSTSSSSTLSST